MAPIFDRTAVLSGASPPTHIIAALSPEFAVLGHLEIVSELLTLLNAEYPLHGLQAPLQPLNLAFAASNAWPEGYTEEEKSAEGLQALSQGMSEELWPQGIEEADQKDNVDGLKIALEYVKELEEGLAAQASSADADLDDDEEDESLQVEISEALVKALEISIKLFAKGKDELDQRSQELLAKIADRLHKGDQIVTLTQCAAVWPYLLKGALAKEIGVDDSKVKALGKEILDTVTEWFKNGPQGSVTDGKSVKELLEVCDKKTRENWPEEVEDLPKPKSLFANKGADAKAIAELEKKLDVKLPADYKEFLGISDGFLRILADDVFEAELHPVDGVEWTDAKEALQMGDMDFDEMDQDDEDEEDEDAPELVEAEGPPAKKMKMMDGNKLLAIAKNAEKARGGGGPASAPADADAEDDEEDSDEEDAALEAALASGLDFPSSLRAELLPLPDMMHEAYAAEHDDAFPNIDKVLQIGGDDDTSLWLLPPAQVTAARNAYVRMYEASEEQEKKMIRWAMIAWAGSEQKFREYDDWAFVGFSGNGGAEMNVWAGFRRYLQDMAMNCEAVEPVKKGEEEQAERDNGCFAYRLR